jgi:hypothetical protein
VKKLVKDMFLRKISIEDIMSITRLSPTNIEQLMDEAHKSESDNGGLK